MQWRHYTTLLPVAALAGHRALNNAGGRHRDRLRAHARESVCCAKAISRRSLVSRGKERPFQGARRCLCSRMTYGLHAPTVLALAGNGRSPTRARRKLKRALVNAGGSHTPANLFTASAAQAGRQRTPPASRHQAPLRSVKPSSPSVSTLVNARASVSSGCLALA